MSLSDLTTTHNNKTEADCLFEPDSLPIDRECLSLDTVMGQMLTAIFNTDSLKQVFMDKVEQLGGEIVISERGEYAIVDFEGFRS